jgi:hypothetical protein
LAEVFGLPAGSIVGCGAGKSGLFEDRHPRIALAAVGQIAQSGDHAAGLRIDAVLAMDKVRALAGVPAWPPGRRRGNVDRRAQLAAEGGTGECRADALATQGSHRLGP